MQHGGDILSYQHLYNGELLDFSSNINPLGYPRILDEVFSQPYKALTAYPDIHYRNLRQSLAEYLGCQADEVLVGNGSVDILDYFCRLHRRVLLYTPCFGEYQERAAESRTPVTAVPLITKAFECSSTNLQQEVQAGDVVILGNPNNPTGRRIKCEDLLTIARLTADRKAFFVLDEAFFEFCPEDYDSIQVLHGQEHVCVIRAATKFFGLPGIRLGYGYAVPRIARQYAQSALPWRVNAFADLAGQIIFHDIEFIRNSKSYIACQRDEMLSQLRNMSGFHVYDTEANFLLIRLFETDEQTVFEQCLRRGILIRKASSFDGLDQSYIRIAIKDRNSNQRLFQAFDEIFEKKKKLY